MIKKVVIYTILAPFMFVCIMLAVYILMNRNHDIESHSFEHDADYYRLVSDKYMIRISKTGWSNLNKKAFAYKDIDEYLSHCQDCIQYITERTGKNDWMDELPNKSDDGKAIVTIIFMKGITSQAKISEGNIILNEENMEGGRSQIEHELTHMIMGSCEEGTLSEGFASYMAQTEFDVEEPPSYELDPDMIVQNVFLDEQHEEIYRVFIDAVGNAHDWTIKHKADGLSFYVLACSYVKYLINTYDIETIVALYDADGTEEGYQRIIGKDVSAVKKDWLKYLEKNEGKMTSEEIFSYIQERRKKYQLE